MDEIQTMERAVPLSGGIVNMQTGEFPMLLATEGEAADGHICGVSGARALPDSIAMLWNHESTEMIPSLGKIHSIRHDTVDGIAALRATGMFRLDGTGPLADIRRDYAHLVNNGDLQAVSMYWSGRVKTRRSLGAGHKFYGERGLYWPEPVPKEGSICAIGIDHRALIGRSEAADNEATRIYWRLLSETERDENGQRSLADAFAAFNAALTELRAVGCTADDVVRMADLDSSPVFDYEVGGCRVSLPGTVYGHITQMEREYMNIKLQAAADREAARSLVEVEPDREAALEEPDREAALPKRNATVDLARCLATSVGPAIRDGMASAFYAKTGKRKL